MEVNKCDMLRFSLCYELVLSESMRNKQEQVHHLIFNSASAWHFIHRIKLISIMKCHRFDLIFIGLVLNIKSKWAVPKEDK
jgi:hypothetical protein